MTVSKLWRKTRDTNAYQRFLKEVLHQVPDDTDEIAEIIAQNPDLDFI